MVSSKTDVTKIISDNLTDADILAIARGEATFDGEVTEYSDLAPTIPIVFAEELVGVPFVILRAEEHMGDYGPFISLSVMYNVDGKQRVGILNNGSLSSGVFAQMNDLTAQGVKLPVSVRKGLRKSEYQKEMPNGSSIPAKTYYLSN
jgi:hypothetical protein